MYPIQPSHLPRDRGLHRSRRRPSGSPGARARPAQLRGDDRAPRHRSPLLRAPRPHPVQRDPLLLPDGPPAPGLGVVERYITRRRPVPGPPAARPVSRCSCRATTRRGTPRRAPRFTATATARRTSTWPRPKRSRPVRSPPDAAPPSVGGESKAPRLARTSRRGRLGEAPRQLASGPCSWASTSAARSPMPSSSPGRRRRHRQGADDARRPVASRSWPPSQPRSEEAGATAADVERFAHGMTVATNALLEGRGARTALVATDGFNDVVELGRQDRARPLPAVRRAPGAARPAAAALRRARAHRARRRARAAGRRSLRWPTRSPAASREAVAVCLLHAYRHPDHERAIGAALRERLGDDVAISLSHEVVGTFREYERAATTEVDAALSPLLRAYLRRAARPRARRPGCPSRGSCSPAAAWPTLELAAAHAALTVLSGPAGGAAAAALLAARCRRARPAVLRHGRHVVRRVRRRGRSRARRRRARGRRAAAGAADGRHPHRRRRRRLDRVARRRRRAARRPASARAPSPDPRATGAAAPSRRSPTPTSCSATSTPTRRWPAASRSTPTPRTRPSRAGRRARRSTSTSAPRGSCASPTPRWSARCGS